MTGFECAKELRIMQSSDTNLCWDHFIPFMAGHPNFGATQISCNDFIYGRLCITFFNKVDGPLIVCENGIETMHMYF